MKARTALEIVALNKMILQALSLSFISLANRNICKLFPHLYSTYVNITADDMAKNDASMKGKYDVNIPIASLFK